MQDLHILVVGAGIGGLQAALALSARSFTVTVFEAVKEFAEIGAGIRVPPNSNLLSQSWGVDFSAIKKNVSLGNRFVDWKGNRLLDVPFEDSLETRYGAPYYFLHRADLMNLLLETAQARSNIEIRFGCKVVDYDFEAPKVTLEDGQTVAGDLIVGCDGIKSIVRDKVNDKPCPPLDTGDVAYRILVPAAPLRDNPATKHLITDAWATHWIGPSAHAVGYPLRGGELYNIIIDITHDTDPSPPLSFSDWMQKHSNGELLDRFSDWCPEVSAILSLTGTYLKWKLADFDQLDTWIHKSNRALLLGDACHPMMP
jgi:salicylate hydroxylase